MELDYQPRAQIQERMEFPYGEPEMTTFESAFLCGLIKQAKPRKILELGVAGGATTAIILQALADTGNDFRMHSVDLCERFYRDNQKQTGFLGKMAADILGVTPQHSLHLGKPIPYVIDEIGEGIDFAILDTTHSLPGELLDFIVLLPYMKNGGIVVLHDISYNQRNCNVKYGYATNVLFNVVTGEKYFQFTPEDEGAQYPNIGAFAVGEDTRKYCDDLFRALTITWTYSIQQPQKDKYLEIIQKNYNSFEKQLAEQAFALNEKMAESKLSVKQRIRKSAKIMIKGYY